MSETGDRHHHAGPTSGELTVRVRYQECDPMNVAHHSVFAIWFEMGRTELLRESGLRYRDFEAAGVFLAVTSLNISYKAPARYDDLLTLRTTLTRMTRVKIEHAYELVRDGTVVATGSSTLACLGEDGRPRLLPDALFDVTSA